MLNKNIQWMKDNKDSLKVCLGGHINSIDNTECIDDHCTCNVADEEFKEEEYDVEEWIDDQMEFLTEYDRKLSLDDAMLVEYTISEDDQNAG